MNPHGMYSQLQRCAHVEAKCAFSSLITTLASSNNVTPFRMGIVRKRAHCYWANLDEGKNLDGRISTRQIRKLSGPSSIPYLGVKVRSHAPSQKFDGDQHKMHLKDKDAEHQQS